MKFIATKNFGNNKKQNMNLVEFLKDVEKNIPSAFKQENENFLQGERLRVSFIYDKLKTIDEFSECDLDIIDSPIFDGVQTQVLKLGKNTRFKGKMLLYSITLTPTMYNPESFRKPIKDGCVITPTIYNPEDFTPFKEIIIRFNVEAEPGITEEMKKEEIKRRLEDILNNPKDYETKGERGILIRGVFSEYTSDKTSEKI